MLLNEDFLLKNETAKKLYHEFAAEMPIVDYHCHINPQEIYEDRQFENITHVWFGGDHYKWRLIRSNGVCEDEITGNADDLTKFRHFAKMLSKAIGNPMYHWTHYSAVGRMPERYARVNTKTNFQQGGIAIRFYSGFLGAGSTPVTRTSIGVLTGFQFPVRTLFLFYLFLFLNYC